jgi:hypothetical protein
MSLNNIENIDGHKSSSGRQHFRIIFLKFATDLFGISAITIKYRVAKHDNLLWGSAL